MHEHMGYQLMRFEVYRMHIMQCKHVLKIEIGVSFKSHLREEH